MGRCGTTRSIDWYTSGKGFGASLCASCDVIPRFGHYGALPEEWSGQDREHRDEQKYRSDRSGGSDRVLKSDRSEKQTFQRRTQAEITQETVGAKNYSSTSSLVLCQPQGRWRIKEH